MCTSVAASLFRIQGLKGAKLAVVSREVVATDNSTCLTDRLYLKESSSYDGAG